MGAGLYGLNGVGPEVCMWLIEIFVITRMIYGLECLPIASIELEPMETYYRELLRKIQHLPESTANAAVYLLVGALPVEALIHIKTLTLFGQIMRRQDSIEYEIVERQLAIKEDNSHSWSIHVKLLLETYGLPSPLQLLYCMATKDQWRKCVTTHVHKLWYDQLKTEARAKKTLNHINLDNCKPGMLHSIWDLDTTDPLIAIRASIHAKILVQRYPLNTSRTSKSNTDICPCCDEQEETLAHFLLDCPELQQERTKHIQTLKNEMEKNGLEPNRENTIAAILDPSSLSTIAEFIECTTKIARTLCFNLHLKRLRLFTDEKTRLNSATSIKNATTILTYRPTSTN